MTMTEENDLIFCEEQKFSLWLSFVVLFSMIFAIAIVVFTLTKQALDTLPLVVTIVCGIIVPIAIALLFKVAKLETEVRADALYIRYFPFHIDYKKFAKEDLSECYARTYKPIREYGGWGIRYSFRKGRGKAYNLSGNKGVQLVFKNGKKLLIGSHKPDELAEAINSIMKKP